MQRSLDRRIEELERNAYAFDVRTVTAQMVHTQMAQFGMKTPAVKAGDTAGDYIGRMEQHEVVALTRRLWQEAEHARDTQ